MIDVRGEGGYVVAAGSRLHARPGRDDSSAGTGRARLPPGRGPSAGGAARLADRRHRCRPAAGRQAGRRATSDRGQHGTRPWTVRATATGPPPFGERSDRVRSAPVGQRNHTLNSAAYSLGQLVAAGALDQDRAVEALTAAAESAGLEPAEIAATIDSGLTAGARRPRVVPTQQQGTTNNWAEPQAGL